MRQKQMNKRAVVSTLVNILIGLLLIAVSFLLFYLINGEIESLSKSFIREEQNKDLANTYSNLFAKMDKELLDDFIELTVSMHKDDDKFFAHKSRIGYFGKTITSYYDTFRGDIGSDPIEDGIIEDRGSNLFVYEGTIYEFNFFAKFPSQPEKPESCPERVTCNLLLRRSIPEMGECTLQQQYCDYLEVIE